MEIKLAVIDDREVVINGLAAMLPDQNNIKIEYATTNAEALRQYLSANKTDVLLLDIQMPGISGVDLCKQILKLQPGIKILAFTSFDDSHYVKQMMRSGASGYILKNADKQTIVKAIQTVMEGEEFLDE